MVKINDVSTFPNTTPASDDHVIGTDVSDTTNSADGEVVTFTLGEIANLNFEASWHPYDMTSLGDGSDGKFYDYSVDGGVTTFVTPDFEDGYDYAVRLEGLSVSTNDLTLKIEGYLETSAAYDTQQTLTGTIDSPGTLDGLLVFKSVRRSLYLHRLEKEYLVSNVFGTITDEGLLVNLITSHTTAQKITRLRFGTTFTTDAGKAYLYRRRNHTL